MDQNDFTHLHLHSMYSLLDGENRIEAIPKKVKEFGMKQVALTDHGVMMGTLNFYKACRAEGIKPILGVEAYITEDPDGMVKEERTRDNFHLIMIAQNEIGYKNLIKLCSSAQLNNFYFKPRISKKNLNASSLEGIVASSACMGSNINRVGKFIPESRCYESVDKMYATARYYHELFEGRYYLELQDNDDAAGQQKAYNDVLIRISDDIGAPCVITSDAHYTTEADSKLHSTIMAMQFKQTLAEYEEAGEMKYGPWFYIKSPTQMLEAAKKYNREEAFWAACAIGNSCQEITIELGKYKTPEFDIKSDPDYDEFVRTRHEDE